MTASSVLHLPTSAPAAEPFFELWLAAQRQAPRPVSDESAAPIRHVWMAWCRFLASRRAPVDGTPLWCQAGPVDVQQFIQSRDAQVGRHRDGDGPSSVTQYRYARLLDRLYRFAVIHAWVSVNPFMEMARAERPELPEQTGAVLPAALWSALPRFFPEADGQLTTDLGDVAIAARDRAVLSLLYYAGLSPQEVRLLRIEQLQLRPGRASVQIEGERKAQAREIPLPAEARLALLDWDRRRRAAAPEAADGLVFATRRGNPLSKRILFNLVAKVIEAAAASSSLQGQAPVRIGPQVIRNTVLYAWLLSGVSVSEVVMRAGLKDARALRRLGIGAEVAG